MRGSSTRESHVKRLIRRRYAHIAAADSGGAGGRARAASAGYPLPDLARVPPSIVDVWSGCGNVLQDVDLEGGETVVDLGSGGGLDVYLIATSNPPPECVIAIDLTPEMLARLAAAWGGAQPRCVNAIAGDMEMLPLADEICDLVVANASLNLSLNMHAALVEVARILRPGGRLRACELVRDMDSPPELMADPMGHAASLGGVPLEAELLAALDAAGFQEVAISGRHPFPPMEMVRIRARKPDGLGVNQLQTDLSRR